MNGWTGDNTMKAGAIFLTAVFLVVLTAASSIALYHDENEERIFLTYCKTCHSPDWALKAVKSEENWRLTIERMSFQYKMFSGKEIPPVDQEIILEYLLWKTGGD
jgi:hypothetical protein